MDCRADELFSREAFDDLLLHGAMEIAEFRCSTGITLCSFLEGLRNLRVSTSFFPILLTELMAKDRGQDICDDPRKRDLGNFTL
jgi:hypothetical protein